VSDKGSKTECEHGYPILERDVSSSEAEVDLAMVRVGRSGVGGRDSGGEDRRDGEEAERFCGHLDSGVSLGDLARRMSKVEGSSRRAESEGELMVACAAEGPNLHAGDLVAGPRKPMGRLTCEARHFIRERI
jgi:hypothetical protein